jgi:hypothetical protein
VDQARDDDLWLREIGRTLELECCAQVCLCVCVCVCVCMCVCACIKTNRNNYLIECEI